MKYHLGRSGPAPCKATKIACPLGGEEVHFSSKQEAEKAYEHKMKDTLLPKPRKADLTDELVANGGELYPREALVKLGKLLQERPYKPLVVMPAGSTLYNTAIPGREVHDYDFVVFCSPSPTLRNVHQTMEGELDVNFVDVTKLTTLANRSSSFSESLFAHNLGRGLNTPPDDAYTPMLSALRLSEIKYFDLLDDVMRSHRQQFTEPVTQESPTEFRNFKHTVRWMIYQQRWGSYGKPMDPRLSSEERERWLHTLEAGRTEALFS